MSDQYAAIAAHRTQFPVTLMCRVLDVSCSGFYAALGRVPSARTQADEPMRVQIRTAFRQSRKRFGAPRIMRALRAQCVRVSTKRIARLMQTDGLQGRRPRRFVITTQRNPADRVAPNLLDRDFDVRATRPLNTVWVSDVTFIPTQMGWLYLAIVLDLASRRVVGWATSAHNDTALVLAALQRALAPRQPAAGWWHHSDQGRTYTSDDYRAAIANAHGIASMSRRGNCWDNAVAESFFATLEWELLDGAPFATHTACHDALVTFIDTWYSHERMHSSLAYQTPVQFEQDLLRTRRAA